MGILGKLGKIAKKIGEKVLEIALTWVLEKLSHLADTGSYDTKDATIEETQKINELLDKCIRSYQTETEKYDSYAIVILEEQFNLMKGILGRFNDLSGEKIIEQYVFDNLENNFRYLRRKVDRIYSRQIAEAFSLNNSKLLNILKLDKGLEKKQKINALATNTIIAANNDLLCSISNFVYEQQQFVEKILKEYMDNVKTSMTKTQSETQKIFDAKKNDKELLEKMRKKYDELLYQFSLLENVLNREKI